MLVTIVKPQGEISDFIRVECENQRECRRVCPDSEPSVSHRLTKLLPRRRSDEWCQGQKVGYVFHVI